MTPQSCSQRWTAAKRKICWPLVLCSMLGFFRMRHRIPANTLCSWQLCLERWKWWNSRKCQSFGQAEPWITHRWEKISFWCTCVHGITCSANISHLDQGIKPQELRRIQRNLHRLPEWNQAQLLQVLFVIYLVWGNLRPQTKVIREHSWRNIKGFYMPAGREGSLPQIKWTVQRPMLLCCNLYAWESIPLAGRGNPSIMLAMAITWHTSQRFQNNKDKPNPETLTTWQKKTSR